MSEDKGQAPKEVHAEMKGKTIVTDLRAEQNTEPVRRESQPEKSDDPTEKTTPVSRGRGVKIVVPKDDDDDDDNDDDTTNVPDATTKQLSVSIRPSVIDATYSPEVSDDESIASIESVGSFHNKSTLNVDADFFEAFEDMPSLKDFSDTSVDDTLLDFLRPTLSISEVEELDEGKFVNPLTGSTSSSTIDLTKEPEAPMEMETIEEAEDSSAEDHDLLEVPELPEDKALDKPDEEDMFNAFIEAEAHRQDITLEEFDWEAYQYQQNLLYIERTTVDFLNQLINSTVELCEYVDPKVTLRKKLDKLLVFNELAHRLTYYDTEVKTRYFLQRKVVEYFRRRKEFRPITESASEEADSEKFSEAIDHLDYVLGREVETKKIRKAKIEELELQHADMLADAKIQETQLEDFIRNTMKRENFERLKLSVDVQLRNMESVRDEISRIRLIIISRQHNLASILHKSEQLENIGQGLRMQDFENLYTDIYNLDKKVEERNNDLIKLRLRCNADTHIMAHLKEKQIMVKNNIEAQMVTLDELNSEKKQCREYMVNQKILRGKIRREIRELSFQGGLVDKPTLMLDYDETEEKLEKLRADVEFKRRTMSDILEKIEALEIKYNL